MMLMQGDCLKRALKKLNEIARIVEEIKNIDLYKRVAKVTEGAA